MTERSRRRVGLYDGRTDRVRVTMRDAGRSYSPASSADLFFLHGLAVVAARQALREHQELHLPREWDESSPAR